MQSYISGIAIFSNNGERRYVDFQSGVNIITGNSKKGKSALVEIIDYCLCSSRCTIPKGKITEFGDLYCILLVIGGNCLVIARERWEKGGKMFVKVESNTFEVQTLMFNYFDTNFIPPNNVKYTIEEYLGLQVSNMETEDDKVEKASLRNMVSYMFQHQNLMANKFALFYRFDDYYKRQDVINQFPIFSGFIGQEYYSKLLRLNSLKKNLKKLQKDQLKSSDIERQVVEKILPLFEDYYALIGKSFEKSHANIRQLKMLAEKLPEFDLSQIASKKIVDRHKELEISMELLRDEETELQQKINNLESICNVGNDYIAMLADLKEKTKIAMPEKENYSCPLCGKACEDLTNHSKSISEAAKWLDVEVNITERYGNNFFEELRKLAQRKDEIILQIKQKYAQIKYIERTYLKNADSLIDKIRYTKVKIKFYIDTLDNNIFKDSSEDIENLQSEIATLENLVAGFDVDTKVNNAKFNIGRNMNRLAESLDFEDEFKPVNLVLDDKFGLYHQNNHEKIYLSEMGSGANWVSCHIALFLSFLRFFTEQKEKSPMPLILFFDQPSQVYFPRSIKDLSDEAKNAEEQQKITNDIKAVNAIYKTIFNEIDDITKETGITPQIIIVDHVDGEELEINNTFKKFTRRTWRDTALI